MEFHEAANIFPLDEEHLAELVQDITDHGQQVPIELFDGKIIDGRRRWLACQKAGVEPHTIHVSKTKIVDPVAHVMSLNLHRRHLTVSQAAMCAQRAKERHQARNANQPGASVSNCSHPIKDTGKARDKFGAGLGLSGNTMAMRERNPSARAEDLVGAQGG